MGKKHSANKRTEQKSEPTTPIDTSIEQNDDIISNKNHVQVVDETTPPPVPPFQQQQEQEPPQQIPIVQVDTFPIHNLPSTKPVNMISTSTRSNPVHSQPTTPDVSHNIYRRYPDPNIPAENSVKKNTVQPWEVNNNVGVETNQGWVKRGSDSKVAKLNDKIKKQNRFTLLKSILLLLSIISVFVILVYVIIQSTRKPPFYETIIQQIQSNPIEPIHFDEISNHLTHQEFYNVVEIMYKRGKIVPYFIPKIVQDFLENSVAERMKDIEKTYASITNEKILDIVGKDNDELFKKARNNMISAYERSYEFINNARINIYLHSIPKSPL